MKRTLIAAFLGLFIVAGNTSCALRMLEPPPSPSVSQEQALPYKVAILPFVNQTSNPEASAVMRRMFYNFFSSLNYLDAEPSFVDEKLAEKNVYQKITAGDAVSARKLGQMLGVDAVVFGEVLSLGKVYAVLYSDMEASLRDRKSVV